MKKFLLILLTIIFLGSASCSAENFKFIDAMEDTGYYYDADSVQFESPTVLFVKMAVIKADLNRMHVYDVRIFHADRNYRILATKTLSYDTRAVLSTDNSTRPIRKYSDRSEMGQMVNLILRGN